MNKNEQAVISAKDYGSISNLENERTNQLTMNNIPQTEFQSQPKLTNILATETRLFRLSKLPARRKLQLPTKAAGCVGCGGKLDPDDTIQQSVRSCRKCLGIYARVETSFDDASMRKRRELLEKMTTGGEK